MKITMLSVGSTGDVRPYVLLGKELSSRGHQITISAFSRFSTMVEEAGLRFFRLSGDAEKMMSAILAPDTNGLTYLPRLKKSMGTVMPSLIQDMSDSCADADAMVCNFFGTIYYSIAEKYRIPCIQTQYFPMDPTREMPISVVRNQHLGSMLNEFTYKLGYLLIGTVEKKYLSDWRETNHVPVRLIHAHPDYLVNGHPVPVIYAISPHVLPRPADWPGNIHMSGFWFSEEDDLPEPSDALVRFIEEGPQPIYIGFGSMNSGDMNRLMTVVLRALHATRLRAVIHTGWSGAHLRSNRSVFFTDFVPHDWLFPRMRAVVHHGGAGTTASGLRHGKPTLIVHFGGDQAFWGSRVYRLGCGPRPIARERITVSRLSGALLDLTSRVSYRIAAEEIGKKLSEEHGILNACDMIEQEIVGWNTKSS